MVPNPLPLRVDRSAVQERSMQALTRACISVAYARLNPGSSSRAILQRWGDEADRVERVMKAASTPAMTTTWGSQFATISVALLSNLIGSSAAADLFGRAIALTFNGAAQINMPVLTIAQANFVKQGDAIPVIAGNVAIQTTLLPYKFAVITALTREMVESSNAEQLVRIALLEATGPALDAKLFDANPAITDLRPGGLLFGVTPLTPTTGGGFDAMVGDLSKLAASVAGKAGNNGFCYVASPKQAVSIGLSTLRDVAPVLVSTTLAAGTIICVANNGVVFAADDPVIDTTTAASWHSDTAPVPIGTTPPVYTAFQKDILGLRLKWPIAWAVRDPAAVAVMNSVTWPAP
jgi:hypothetical protein